MGKPELYDRWLRELWPLRAAGTLRTAVHEEIPATTTPPEPMAVVRGWRPGRLPCSDESP
ncbi:hypothetical protein [Streptomyces nojiriensis]|uniref:hypothetical protein n=1 Tax=Streptomyces nojiriensis TaxID=66374 RepID=UPI001671A7DA|nr:hypothetical protein [Streptomyces nojiriensis]